MKFLLTQPLAVAFFSVAASSLSISAGDWPQWTGPSGDGIAPGESAPLEWTAENQRWRTPLPAPGNSSPIVAGGRVFLTSADENGKRRSLLCFDREDGKLLWESGVDFPGKEATHKTNPHGAASPATDGERIFVSFASAGAAAYDFAGKELWRRDLGKLDHIWGSASSPVVCGDAVIFLWGPGTSVKLVALKRESGETLWETPLPEAAAEKPDQFKGSWTTPLRWQNGARAELICPLPGKIASFDPATGNELWRCSGLGDLYYTNALVGSGVIVGMSGYGGPAIGMKAPAPGETGDLTETHRLWRTEKNTQRIGSGIIHGGCVYLINESGIMQCLDLKTGGEIWKERAARQTWGSLRLIGDRLFSTDLQGTTRAIKPSPDGFEKLAESPLEKTEMTRATAAFSGGQVFLRTYEALYCFGEK